MISNTTLRYDPLRLDEDPYPIYRWLRAEAPVYLGANDAGEFWALSRFEDVDAAVNDWQTFSSAQGNDLDDTGLLFGPEPAMDLCDPPLHGTHRKAMLAEFRRATAEPRLEEITRRVVRDLINKLSERDVFDFAEEFGYTLPFTVICQWLGIPDSDHAELKQWHATMLRRDLGQTSLPMAAVAAQHEMFSYLESALLDRRVKPRDDLITALSRAQHAGAMSEGEALANAFFFFDAGIVSTSALLSSALLHLTEFEPQRQLLWADPNLIPAAIEEFLRFDAPFQWFTRVTTRDVRIHDVTIHEGARVVLIWASANRDERRWEDAEKLILDRPLQRHLSFSGGVHRCLGAALARKEVRVAFQELIAAVADYEIVGPVRRRVTPSERTIATLPLRVEWAHQ